MFFMFFCKGTGSKEQGLNYVALTYPGTHYVAQTGLQLMEAFCFRLLKAGLWVCASQLLALNFLEIKVIDLVLAGMGMHISNPSIQETEAGRLRV